MIDKILKTALIVDDAPQARTLLRLMLADVRPDITIVAEASNLQEAIEAIGKYKPSFVFLDVEMPEHLGIQIFDFLPETLYPFELIFVTAYEEFALQALKIGAADYLLKPLQSDELCQALKKAEEKLQLKLHSEKYQRFIQKFQNLDEQKITLPGHRGNMFIKMSDILYLEAEGNYTHFHLNNSSPKLVSRNLKEFEDELQATELFYRSHRSFLINIEKIRGYLKQPTLQVLLENGKTVPLARQKKAEFIERFGA